MFSANLNSTGKPELFQARFADHPVKIIILDVKGSGVGVAAW